MVYLERVPHERLRPFVQVLWYARDGHLTPGRERVLPNGCVQVIFNLSRGFLLDCAEGADDRRMPSSLVVGARSVYEIIDKSDLADLIGVVFAPAGFSVFAREAVHQFSHRTVPLEDVWGFSVGALRDRLLETVDPEERLACLESYLADRLAAPVFHSEMVRFGLHCFRRQPVVATVREVAKSTGYSERRFSQVFREEVGLSPKAWCRVQRFQQAVQLLHAGADLRWAELALECGYYDQSHFANEFRAFSGVDATTYLAGRTQWANHIAVD